MIYDVAILGGGASGIAAAVSLAKKGINVVILEAKPRLGQKILVTGNGRCNLTNLDIGCENYHSENPEIVEMIITRYGCEQVRAFFSSIGLLTRNRGGLVYPLSNKAASVLDCLRNALAKYEVAVITGFDIKSADKQNGNYIVKDCKNSFVQAKKLVVATGSRAYNGTDTGLSILKKFGHCIKKPYPALVQLKSVDPFIKGLKGTKFIGEIKVYKDNKLIRGERGEILFTDYGISGIAVMQVSYLFSLYDNLSLELDFMPDMDLSEVKETLKNIKTFYSDSSVTEEEYLSGLIDKKLGTRVLKYSNSSTLAKSLKAMQIKISEPGGLKNAQVCGGGAVLSGFSQDTLESNHTKGLYAIGETLDAAGDCGGYNLHWAWATALHVSKAIGESYDKNK